MLADNGIMAQKHKAESTKKEWELAEEMLKKIRLFSPARGKVDKKEIETGEFVGPEKDAFTILKIDKVYAEVGITEKDITKVEKGQTAKIKVDAYPNNEFQGTVKNIFPSVKGASRTLTLKIELDNQEYGYKLLPGMFLRGDIIIKEIEDTYIVPEDTLMQSGNQEYSLLMVEPKKEFSDEELAQGEGQGKVILRKVELIYKGAEYAAVSGVKEGDLVIVRSQGNIVPFTTTGIIINVEEYEE